MDIPWELIIDLLYQWLEGCDETPEGRLAILKDRKVTVFLKVTKAIRQQGIRGKELREAREFLLTELQEATEEDLRAFAANGSTGLLND